MSNNKTHWENIYKNNNFKNVSWFQEKPTTISFIDNLNLSKDCKIIDVGAGASYLGTTLIDKGYKNITINDISALSIEISESHNIHNLKKISFLIGDITNLKLPKNYFNLWHDRAVFHFLTEKEKREKYINQIRKSLLIHGYIIISVFSLDGPKKCSSLTIKQYDETTLSSELGECFKLINFSYSNHLTPSNKKQNFITCCFKLIKK